MVPVTARQQLGKYVREYLRTQGPEGWWYRSTDACGEKVHTHANDGEYDATANYTGFPWAQEFLDWLDDQWLERGEGPDGDLDALSSYEVGLKLWPVRPKAMR